MNILYLLHILKTKKLSELVANIDAPMLDINLAIWEAEKNGDVEINVEKDTIEALRPHEVTFDSDLADKLMKVVKHYHSKEMNITRGRLNALAKNAGSDFNYPYHTYVTTLQYLIDSEQIFEEVISVPEIKNKRPYHKFVFLCSPGNPNEDWNREEVNKWIANWNKKK